MYIIIEILRGVLIYSVCFVVSILIIRNIARKNEWDTSYVKAFYVVITWGIISIFLGPGLNIIINDLIPWATISTSGIFTTIKMLFYLGTHILFYCVIIFIVSVLVKKLYEGTFRESFSMLILFLVEQALLTIAFLPILPIFI
jgi:hypothetical protein